MLKKKTNPSHGVMPERKQENLQYTRNKMKQKSNARAKERKKEQRVKRKTSTDAPKTSGISHCNS